MSQTSFGSPSAVGRRLLGGATVVTALLGLGADPRWLAASGAFGLLWWAWDFLWGNVLGPLGGWFTDMLAGTAEVEEGPDLSADDTIRLLERHLTDGAAPRHVQIQAALRLAEMYRLNRHDEAKAREVIETVRTRFPDAPELRTFEKNATGGGAGG